MNNIATCTICGEGPCVCIAKWEKNVWHDGEVRVSVRAGSLPLDASLPALYYERAALALHIEHHPDGPTALPQWEAMQGQIRQLEGTTVRWARRERSTP